jgi:hypothetical protein
MPTVEVTPVGSWKNAIYCTVKDLSKQPAETHTDVPIFRKYPQSNSDNYAIPWVTLPIVILNEQDPTPDNSQPITDSDPQLNVKWASNTDNPLPVPLLKNIGWPNGVIILKR